MWHMIKWTLFMSHIISFGPICAVMFLKVAARTETGVRRRTQAMSHSCSKRKSRFSSIWGLDTTSKKKTKAHPTVSQVCVALKYHILKFWSIDTTELLKKTYFTFSTNNLLLNSAWGETTRISFCVCRCLLMVKSPRKSPQIAFLLIL